MRAPAEALADCTTARARRRLAGPLATTYPQARESLPVTDLRWGSQPPPPDQTGAASANAGSLRGSSCSRTPADLYSGGAALRVAPIAEGGFTSASSWSVLRGAPHSPRVVDVAAQMKQLIGISKSPG